MYMNTYMNSYMNSYTCESIYEIMVVHFQLIYEFMWFTMNCYG